MLTSKQCDQVLLASREKGYAEAGRLFVRLLTEDKHSTVQWLTNADSELSAIAHGRQPSDKYALLSISHHLRKLYE